MKIMEADLWTARNRGLVRYPALMWAIGRTQRKGLILAIRVGADRGGRQDILDAEARTIWLEVIREEGTSPQFSPIRKPPSPRARPLSLHKRCTTTAIRWVPEHQGVMGNEVVDT